MKAVCWLIGLYILNAVLPCILGKETTEGKSNPGINTNLMDFWVIRVLYNLVGYATIFVPGYLLIRYFRKVRYHETGSGVFAKVVRSCVFGNEMVSLEEGGKKEEDTEDDDSQTTKFLTLIFCVAGLQGAYLTWGALQERIMTFEYGTATQKEYFKNSQFLVFINRILAFMIGCTVLWLRPQPYHTAPVYKYSFSSFSNIMSSWCQYEALKFVSFPTQVLAKASKVIPVMLMGKVVSRRSYDYHEYVTAALISVGVSMFLLTSGDVTRHKGSVTTVSGIILLTGYMSFDSFTSNWQGELFRRHKMSPIQMMTGVNMFSCLLTAVSLLEQGGFFDSVGFMGRNPNFVFHAVILSLCSAVGQLFIFFTISKFGPVTFTIIMTMRQGLAILLSCILYGHSVSFIGALGIFIVFTALFLRIYASYRKKAIQKAKQTGVHVSKV